MGGHAECKVKDNSQVSDLNRVVTFAELGDTWGSG